MLPLPCVSSLRDLRARVGGCGRVRAASRAHAHAHGPRAIDPCLEPCLDPCLDRRLDRCLDRCLDPRLDRRRSLCPSIELFRKFCEFLEKFMDRTSEKSAFPYWNLVHSSMSLQFSPPTAKKAKFFKTKRFYIPLHLYNPLHLLSRSGKKHRKPPRGPQRKKHQKTERVTTIKKSGNNKR